jgi:Tol biopolymer transport system component
MECPSWSPTGDRFVGAVAGSVVINGDVVVVDTLTKAWHSVAAGYTPAWSPTGEWIAYVTRVESGDTLEAEIRLVHPDGTDDHPLYRSDQPDVYELLGGFVRVGIPSWPLAWSYDGRSVAFSRHSREGTEVWMVSTDRGVARRLTGRSPTSQ